MMKSVLTIFQAKRILPYMLCFYLLAAGVTGVVAQGTGNHLTMYLDSCIQTSSNTIQFSLFVSSDGDPLSDLRPNSFQYGVNFFSGILEPGATVTPSFVPGSSDFIPPLNDIVFPPSTFIDHIKIVQPPYSIGNTGITMVIGHIYRFGTFVITSSSDWVENNNANLSLQSTVASGKTVTAGCVYVGASPVTTCYSATGTGNGQRSVVVNCNLMTTSIDRIENESPFRIYPNPASDRVHITDDRQQSESLSIEIFDVLGQKISLQKSESQKSSMLAGRKESEIDVSGLSSGIYFLELTDGQMLYQQKVVIE